MSNSTQTQTQTNCITRLSFSGPHINACAVTNADNYKIKERTIVTNVGSNPALVKGTASKFIRPFYSTILQNAVIEQAEQLVLISIVQEKNMGRVIFEKGWQLYWDCLIEQIGAAAAAACGFPKDTPLWRSAQDTIASVSFDPAFVTGQKEQSDPQAEKSFATKVNIWFAPALTDCCIHNKHDFIEVHTQVYGTGRLQKFSENDHKTLYEDIPMAPGYTTPEPFCMVSLDGGFVYPWHQYYADIDCIWMAVEYHPN